MKTNEKVIDTNIKLSVKDRINYTIAEFGYNSIYYWISAFMTIFFTDQMGIKAGMVSLLLLVVRIFDGINDPLIGSMADRSKSDRFGNRYTRWVRWGAIGMCTAIFLLFCCQAGWSYNIKCVYMWVIYIMVTVMSTCCNMPYGAINGVLTSNGAERTKASGMRMLFANTGANVCAILSVPMLLLFSRAGGQQTPGGYRLAILVTIVVGLPLLIWSSYHTKEVVQPPKNQIKIPVGKQFAAFFKNKYAIIAALGFFMIGFSAYGRMTIQVYYFTYVSGHAGLNTYAGYLGLFGAIVGSGFLSIWIYNLVKHKGYQMMICYGLGGLFSIPCFFTRATGQFAAIFWICQCLSLLFQNAGSAAAYGIVGDASDMGELKAGVRVDGFLASFVSLMMKAGGAVGPAILVALIDRAGYVPNVSQNESVLSIINFGMTIAMSICCFLIVVMYCFYDLNEKKHDGVRRELEMRHAKIAADMDNNNF